MLRTILIFLVVVALSACTSAPVLERPDDAVAAARALMGSLKPWAGQASYEAKRRGADWFVIVRCKKCRLPNHGRVVAAYVVRVDAGHRARIVTGYEK